MNFLNQNAADEIIIGPILDCVDGKTPVETLVLGDITAAIYKGSTRTPITLTASGGDNNFTHVADGYWKLTLTAANKDTNGRFKITLRDDDVFLSVTEDFYILPNELPADPANFTFMEKLLWLIWRLMNKNEKDAAAKKVYVCDDAGTRKTEQAYTIIGNNETFQKAVEVSE